MTFHPDNARLPNYVEVHLSDPLYPDFVKKVLGRKAPAVLHCAGNLALLDSVGVGFCGSRKSSLKGIETTQDCAEQAAVAGFSVVSGNAAGVDFAAHYTALQKGGNTILVLPEGINQFRIKKELLPVWDWSRVLVVSQFLPDAAWKAFRAMERNLLIIALSRATIVIEAGEKGGTLNAGLMTLKLGRPLHVAVYGDMSESALGNLNLLSQGGKKLGKSRMSGRANLVQVFEDMKQGLDGPSTGHTAQLGLL